MALSGRASIYIVLEQFREVQCHHASLILSRWKHAPWRTPENTQKRKSREALTAVADVGLGMSSEGGGLEGLDALLHSLQVAPVVAVLAETPSHEAADALAQKGGDLLLDQLGGIPAPVQAGLGVPVPLGAGLGVGLALGESLFERGKDVESLASAEAGLASSVTVSGCVSTVSQVSFD